MRYDDRTSLRLAFRLGFLLIAGVAFVIETSCDDEGSSRDLGPGGDGGAAPFALDGQAADRQAQPPMSTMRLAHLAPGIGPIDFCYQGAKKGTFIGPVLGGVGRARDAAADGSEEDAGVADGDGGDGGEDAPTTGAYRSVSKYQNLQAAGPITIAILEAGATSCANPLTTVDVTLDPGKLSTVALFGQPADGGVALDVVAFTDDRSTQPDKIRVRVVHAALGAVNVAGAGPLVVRAVAAKTTVLTDHVEPRHAAAPSEAVMVDALGYVTAGPVPAPVSIAIGPATTGGGTDAGFDPWQSKGADLELVGGSLHSAFVLSGPISSSFEVLWCADMTTEGNQTACQLVR